MTPTREQLISIEWAAEWDGPDDLSEPMCPACRNLKREGHVPDCWLAACLAAPPPEPQAMPPIEVGDIVITERGRFQRVDTIARVGQNNLGATWWYGEDESGGAVLDVAVVAIYRTPVWTREPRR